MKIIINNTIALIFWSMCLGYDLAKFVPGTIPTSIPLDITGLVVTLFTIWLSQPEDTDK